jgi:hypothetical protein
MFLHITMFTLYHYIAPMIQCSTTKTERVNHSDKIEPNSYGSVMLTVATFDDAFSLSKAIDLCLALQHHLVFMSAVHKERHGGRD